jgi:integrase
MKNTYTLPPHPPKYSKENVAIQIYNNTLRFRFTDPLTKKTKSISLGVEDNSKNREIAFEKAYALEEDIKNNLYNPKNLLKYKINTKIDFLHSKKIFNEKNFILIEQLLCNYLNYIKEINTKKSTDYILEDFYKKIFYKEKIKSKEIKKLPELLLEFIKENYTTEFYLYSLCTSINNALLLAQAEKKIIERPDLTIITKNLNDFKYNYYNRYLDPNFLKEILKKLSRMKAPRGYRDLIIFLASTGIRFNEAVGLTNNSINLEDDTILIKRSIYKINDTYYSFNNSPVRKIPITKDIEKLIYERMKESVITENHFLFDDNLNFLGDTFLKYPYWKDTIKKLNLPYKFNIFDLRHSYIVNQIKVNKDISYIANNTGYSEKTLKNKIKKIF